MQRISSFGDDIHALDGAIVFRQRLLTPDTFWLYDFASLTQIVQATYHRAKFGPHARRILEACEREPTAVSHGSDGSVAVCDFAYDVVRLFDTTGALRSTLRLQDVCGMYGVYGIALTKDDIWLAQPTEDTVLSITLSGSVKHIITSTFSYPEHVLRVGTTLYVSDMGHKRLCMLDVQTLQTTEMARFNETVWEYARVGEHHIVRLKSGIYEIRLPEETRPIVCQANT